MPSTVRPRGPLPARVYWTRRLIVLGVPLMLVVVLARVLGGSSDATDRTSGTAAQAGAAVETSAAPTAGPTAGEGTGEKNKKNKKNRQQESVPADTVPTETVPTETVPTETVPPEPVLAEPTGPCADSDVVATPTITSAPGGADVPITLNLRTGVAEACTWQVSPQTLTLTITSGDDFIWSTRECPDAILVQDVVVRQAVDTPVVVTWAGGRRSDETCSDRTEWAYPGYYHVLAAALGGEATDVQFELLPVTPSVVTQTADPEQGGQAGGQKGGRKGGKTGDETAHTPGEDGGGNSEG